MNRQISYTQINSELYYAALSGYLDLAKERIASGGQVEYREGEFTCLQIAVYHDHLDVVDLLLERGADPNSITRTDKLTPLMLAKSVEMINLLNRYHADPTMLCRYKKTGIFYYADYNYPNLVKEWRERNWPVKGITKAFLLKLIGHTRFDVITALTDFQFTEQCDWDKARAFWMSPKSKTVNINKNKSL